MEALIDGYRRFRRGEWPERRRVFETLASQGQEPKVLAISCVDSRVDPAMIFDVNPGEMLVIRNVASLVPPYAPDAAYHGTSAALEFGVRVLNIPNIVVIGHGACGGVKALLHGAPETARDFVAPWMSLAEPARRRVLAAGKSAPDPQTRCEHEVVKDSLANLMTFPWIAERVENGSIHLYGAWFGIHSGELHMLQPDGSFDTVT